MWKWLLGFVGKKRLSPLHRELAALKTKVARENERLLGIQDDFWDNGGVCCPCCGVPGYSEALDAQERRNQRIRYLENKLKRKS